MNAQRPPLRVSENEVFWAEIAPSEHILHLYADNAAFLEMLEGFTVMGLLAGEGVVVIGTDAHIFDLNRRLGARGIDLRSARERDQYLPLNAEATLATFMNGEWPDEGRFHKLVSELIERAGRDGRRVRAFGELEAILWENGHHDAAVTLEHLWNDLRQTLQFSLFCSYPKSGFTLHTQESLEDICAAHTKVISNHSRLSAWP